MLYSHKMDIRKKITFTYVALSTFSTLLLCIIVFALKCQAPLIPLEILFGNPEKAHPVFSPEGDKFAYLAPRDEHDKTLNLWVRTIDKNDDRIVTNITQRGIAHFLWTYDNKSLIYLYDKDGSENCQLYKVSLETGVTTCLTPFEKVHVGIIEYVKKYPNKLLISMNKDNPAYFDAYELDLDTGVCTMTFKNPGTALGLIADKKLVIRGITQMTEDGGTNVLIRKSANDAWQQIIHWTLEEHENSHVIGFNHEDNKLYILDSRNSNTNRLAAFDLTTNTQQTLFYDEQSPYDIINVKFTPDMSTPIAVIILVEKQNIIVLNKDYEEDFKKLKTLTNGEITSITHNDTDTRWIVGFSHDTAPVRYYYYDRASKQTTFLFSCCPKLEQYQLQPMYPISFTASDGLPIHGYITHSVQSCEKQPLILLVHGGPASRDTWGYDPEAQFLANRGYTCLQINYRGSAGYGKNFLNAGNKEWGRRMHQDLIDAINWAITTNSVDPKRIAIMGGSYGGYAALCGAAFNPDLFCCAVDLFGVSNLITLIKNSPPYWRPLLALLKQRIGDLETEEAMLKERSPLFYAHHIKCPLLIAQGDNDPRCPPEQSSQIIDELKKHNIAYTYLHYGDEGHGIVNQEKRLALFGSIEQFLAQHLGQAQAALSPDLK